MIGANSHAGATARHHFRRDRAFSGATWCRRWRDAATGSWSRPAGLSAPGFLQPLGTVGQIYAVQANLRDPASVAHAVAGADHVVNLVGMLKESRPSELSVTFMAQGSRLIAECASPRANLVQVSAIGADAGPRLPMRAPRLRARRRSSEAARCGHHPPIAAVRGR